jgi:serine/threonine protein kinase
MQDLTLIDQVILERYYIKSPLGEGAMGSVYLASDLQLNRQVALKILRPEWASRPEVVKRLENESRLMAKLGPHQNIVTLFDRLTYEGATVLVMEYVPGEDLADVLARTRSVNSQQEASRKTTPVLAGVSNIILTPSDAISIALQCLAGLDFAHSRGVIHRDIKPSNIMVARDHNGNIVAKVMDFGIGKLLTDPNDSSAIPMTALTQVGGPGPGTPAYMAPEQIDPARFGALCPASDLYAFGITLYEMLTLKLPFDGTYTELLHLHTNVEPPDPRKLIPTLGQGLANVVLRALKKNPNDRYPSAHVFSLELKAEADKAFNVGGVSNNYKGEDKSGVLGLFFGGIGLVAVAMMAFGAYQLFGPAKDSASPAETTPPETVASPESPASTPDSVVTPAPLTPASAAPPEGLLATQTAVAALDQEVNAAMASVSPGEMPAQVTQAREAKKAGDAAYAAGDWTTAEAKYTEATGLYAALKAAPTPATNQEELYAKSEQQNAIEARAAAEKRFADGKADINANPNFTAATKSLADADTALAAGDWNTAAAGYKQAQTSFGGMNPPPPMIAVAEPEPEPANTPVVEPPAPLKPAEPVKKPNPEPPVDTAAKKAAEKAKTAAASAKASADARFKGRNAMGNDTYAKGEALRAEGQRLLEKGSYSAAKEKLQAAESTFEQAKPTAVF